LEVIFEFLVGKYLGEGKISATSTFY